MSDARARALERAAQDDPTVAAAALAVRDRGREVLLPARGEAWGCRECWGTGWRFSWRTRDPVDPAGRWYHRALPPAIRPWLYWLHDLEFEADGVFRCSCCPKPACWAEVRRWGTATLARELVTGARMLVRDQRLGVVHRYWPAEVP